MIPQQTPAAQRPSPRPQATAGSYPFRDEPKVFYVNTTGVCSLDCSYCFTNSAKLPSSLDRSDFEHIFSAYGEKIFFILTGVGDFFAGYRKSEALLRRILAHDVRVYLDFNGVLIHELADLREEERAKLHKMDISFHYMAMKTRGVLDQWLENIVRISKVFPAGSFFIKGIVALPEMERWREQLLYYRQYVHPFTKTPLTLVLDQYDPLLRDERIRTKVLKALASVPGPFVLPKAMENNFHIQTEHYFKQDEAVPCLAGQRYFKVDCRGNVIPCAELQARCRCSLGNVKTRRTGYLEEPATCRQIDYAACLKGWDDRTGWTAPRP